jgi:hypothetical protein
MTLHLLRPPRLRSRWYYRLLAVRTFLRQRLCAFKGHDRYLHTEFGLITLRCVGCQHDTQGWQTGERAYQRTYSGDPYRHQLVPESAALRARQRMRAVK